MLIFFFFHFDIRFFKKSYNKLKKMFIKKDTETFKKNSYRQKNIFQCFVNNIHKDVYMTLQSLIKFLFTAAIISGLQINVYFCCFFYFYQSVPSNKIWRNWSLCAWQAIFDNYRREPCSKWFRSFWHYF